MPDTFREASPRTLPPISLARFSNEKEVPIQTAFKKRLFGGVAVILGVTGAGAILGIGRVGFHRLVTLQNVIREVDAILGINRLLRVQDQVASLVLRDLRHDGLDLGQDVLGHLGFLVLQFRHHFVLFLQVILFHFRQQVGLFFLLFLRQNGTGFVQLIFFVVD